jgi:hypothetical protein
MCLTARAQEERLMPRFYFHLRQGEILVPDLEGDEFQNVSDVETEALETARHILSEVIKTGGDLVTEALLITDENGRMVVTMPISAALPKQFKERAH